MTVVTTTTGNPIPPDALAKLSPDKRAQIEESMKAQAGKPNTETFKTCMTREDLDQDRMIRSEDDSNCTKKILSKTAAKVVIEQTCAAPNASTGRATLEAKTQENIVAIIDTVQGGAAGKIHVELKGRWLGASCQGLANVTTNFRKARRVTKKGERGKWHWPSECAYVYGPLFASHTI